MIFALLLGGCVDAPPVAADTSPWTDGERARLASMRLDPTPRPDPTDRYADDPAAAEIGRALYFDAALSPSGVSCATCHRPDKRFTDGLRVAHGVTDARRHTPTILGSQWSPFLFWDGRADSLWMQALGPLENPDEMGSDRLFVAHRIADGDLAGWTSVFGPIPTDVASWPARGYPDSSDPALVAAWRGMSADQQDAANRLFANAGKAIEAYERKLSPGDSAFDRYVDAVTAGDPTGAGALDDAQVRGLQLFLRRANCVNCHNGPMLTDRAFHNLGLPEPGGGYDEGRSLGAMQLSTSPFNCRGRYSDSDECSELRYLNPTFPDFVSSFKTPTLRNVAETAPYMHNGTLADLPAVLEFYSTLPGTPLAGHRELTLAPLRLTPQERLDLEAFLGGLTGDPLPPGLTRPGS